MAHSSKDINQPSPAILYSHKHGIPKVGNILVLMFAIRWHQKLRTHLSVRNAVRRSIEWTAKRGASETITQRVAVLLVWLLWTEGNIPRWLAVIWLIRSLTIRPLVNYSVQDILEYYPILLYARLDITITVLVLKYLRIGHFISCDAFKSTSPDMLYHFPEATLVHTTTSITRRFGYTSYEHPLLS